MLSRSLQHEYEFLQVRLLDNLISVIAKVCGFETTWKHVKKDGLGEPSKTPEFVVSRQKAQESASIKFVNRLRGSMMRGVAVVIDEIYGTTRYWFVHSLIFV